MQRIKRELESLEGCFKSSLRCLFLRCDFKKRASQVTIWGPCTSGPGDRGCEGPKHELALHVEGGTREPGCLQGC